MNMDKKMYILPGDERIAASDAKEFVHELRTGSWMDSNCTDEQYMCNFAERYVIQAGVKIATDTPENFLADLIRTGYFLYYYTSPFFLSREDGDFLFIQVIINRYFKYLFTLVFL